MPSHQWTMYGSGENRARYVRARELAKRLSTTLTCIVLGYIQSQPFVTAPIVGCQSPEQLQDSALAGDVRLSAEEIAFLEGRAELS
jgi:aryl-alcohol dehydrogenase-like predicted oxidoreductase